MKQTIKNIISVLLIIIGFTIIIHNVIPHDHHYDNKTQNHEKQNSNKNEPLHCHLLNDIDFDIFSNNNLSNNQIISFIIYIETNYFLEENYTSIYNFVKSDNLPNYFLFTENIPTRGSPSIS